MLFAAYTRVSNLLFRSSVSEVLTLWQDQTPHCVVFQTSGGYCCAAFALGKTLEIIMLTVTLMSLNLSQNKCEALLPCCTAGPCVCCESCL